VNFKETLAGFREAMREEGERSVSPKFEQLLYREKSGGSRRLRWAAAFAGLTLVVASVPVYRNQQKRRAAAQEQADTLLLEQVNDSLSRSVSPVMEPLMDPEAGN
jgi:hypothetical protein